MQHRMRRRDHGTTRTRQSGGIWDSVWGLIFPQRLLLSHLTNNFQSILQLALLIDFQSRALQLNQIHQQITMSLLRFLVVLACSTTFGVPAGNPKVFSFRGT
ncbi:hypothetical protein Pst134EA_004730 [Puccinia striiformis f. sp. tritici]|uniref:hypothetical protein n=1 Tax=Puccinia striiformis f. sp. tritici TaxID=168172 RepID=UPI00200809A2|nr:hypothetical protein Pst134EA_004730 [Puccinia striiformis f. sp. tritici]KAH9470808.1 hypothetical protein Pst134EA_004730 [Puccinia striiformis f. sp. tritici]